MWIKRDKKEETVKKKVKSERIMINTERRRNAF